MEQSNPQGKPQGNTQSKPQCKLTGTEKKIIEWTAECDPCKGTGIYVGVVERDGIGVVCSRCKGSGRVEHCVEYNTFVSRKKRTDVKQVIQTNPGIVCGKLNNLTEFGGMPYSDWVEGKPFKRGMEMRRFTCPAWWYQSVDYKRKPDWKECITLGSFSECGYFTDKANCWKRFDKEKVDVKGNKK